MKRAAKDRATRSRARKMGLKGHQVSKTVFLDPRKPWCDSPVRVSTMSDPKDRFSMTVEATGHYPCRKCEKCLKFRRLKWRERALAEIAAAPRTWAITLTFDPLHYAGILAKAKAWAGPNAEKDWVEKKVHRTAYSHIQRYFKRLRKDGHAFRYLAVFERGDTNDRVHYHLLLHETQRPIPKRALQSQWRSFSHCRLVADDGRGAASYITSYATKSFHMTPHASVSYGKGQALLGKDSFTSDPVKLDAQPPPFVLNNER